MLIFSLHLLKYSANKKPAFSQLAKEGIIILVYLCINMVTHKEKHIGSQLGLQFMSKDLHSEYIILTPVPTLPKLWRVNSSLIY